MRVGKVDVKLWGGIWVVGRVEGKLWGGMWVVGRVVTGVGATVFPGRVGWKCVWWVEMMGVCWVVVKVCRVGLYLLSSSIGWKAGDFAASDVSLAFPFWVGSASIFLLRREFSCLSASISSALRFFKSANGQVRGGISRCYRTCFSLFVNSCFAVGWDHLRENTGWSVKYHSVPHGGRQLFLRRTNKRCQTRVSPYLNPQSP